MDNKFVNRIKEYWNLVIRREGDDQEVGLDREKVIVFAISVVLAFFLWLIVNLNRDFSLDVQVPVEVGNITADKALAEKLPENVTASVQGTGWNLINLYNDPPRLYIDVSGEEVNLFDQVRQKMGGSANVTVQTVKPLYLKLKLEPKESKKVPVIPNVDVQFASQYNFVQEPELNPDSVIISGAQSRLETIDYWPTDSVSVINVKESFSKELQLKETGALLNLSTTSVTYSAKVGQFTEGEVRVPVQTRNFPAGNMVSFSPSSVQVKYRVPLSEYGKFGEGKAFAAYVEYAQIQKDTTGFVSPQIEKLLLKSHLKVRSVRPREVAYFTIIQN